MSEELPIQLEFVDKMNAIARVLDKVFNGDERPKKVGWALLVFPFAAPEGARTNYISNAERSDMINSLKEFIARAEGRITDEENVQ